MLPSPCFATTVEISRESASFFCSYNSRPNKQTRGIFRSWISGRTNDILPRDNSYECKIGDLVRSDEAFKRSRNFLNDFIFFVSSRYFCDTCFDGIFKSVYWMRTSLDHLCLLCRFKKERLLLENLFRRFNKRIVEYAVEKMFYRFRRACRTK